MGVKFALMMTPAIIFFYRTVCVIPFIDCAIVVFPPLPQAATSNWRLREDLGGLRECRQGPRRGTIIRRAQMLRRPPGTFTLSRPHSLKGSKTRFCAGVARHLDELRRWLKFQAETLPSCRRPRFRRDDTYWLGQSKSRLLSDKSRSSAAPTPFHQWQASQRLGGRPRKREGGRAPRRFISGSAPLRPSRALAIENCIPAGDVYRSRSRECVPARRRCENV